VESRFSAPVQTPPGVHPVSCKMGNGSFPGVKFGRGVLLTTHPFWCRGHRRFDLYLYPPSGPHGTCNWITILYLTVVLYDKTNQLVRLIDVGLYRVINLLSESTNISHSAERTRAEIPAAPEKLFFYGKIRYFESICEKIFN
jgi:hypothetical protein